MVPKAMFLGPFPSPKTEDQGVHDSGRYPMSRQVPFDLQTPPPFCGLLERLKMASFLTLWLMNESSQFHVEIETQKEGGE